VLLPEYRGRGIYRQFFQQREAYARQLGGMSAICFCAVLRPDNHPRRPQDYQSLDPVWRHFGYCPRSDLIAQFSWKDIDKTNSTDHSMQFWLKAL